MSASAQSGRAAVLNSLARENGPLRATPTRLSPSHFAYLRAWVEGLDRADAARRYLGLDHGHQLRALHGRVVAELRALARRASDSRWRLIGIDVGTLGSQAEAKQATIPPSLAEWVQAQGYEDWSEAEQLALYREALDLSCGPKDPRLQRRQARAQRVRARQLAVLADLERAAAVPALPSDHMAAWLEPATVERLLRAGFVTLGDLQRAVRAGGRWWRGMPGVGPVKATRLASYVDHLLPKSPPRPQPTLLAGGNAAPIALLAPGGPGLMEIWRDGALPNLASSLDGSSGTNRASRQPTIAAQSDVAAARAWVAARARSPLTAATYEREAMRWILWCAIERGKPMSSAGPDDCIEYMRFLNRIPDHWISRARHKRLASSWTPFRGQLGLAGRRLAVKVLSLMCSWLVEHARYLDSNPWGAVSKALADGEDLPPPRASRALTREAYEALSRHAEFEARTGKSPAAARNRFVLAFLRHTGLRAAELQRARMEHLRRSGNGWVLDVVGKGRKPRSVTVSSPARRAIDEYLVARGLPAIGECPPPTPLVATVGAEGGGHLVTYAAVHESFKAFVRRALRVSDLCGVERERTARVTQHWLRHTFATRAAEAEMPQDVLQAELGHADPSTTAGYYTAQEERRWREVERAAAIHA